MAMRSSSTKKSQVRFLASRRPSAIHKKVIGSVEEGQGYADKRKRKFINKYQKIRRKHKLQAERTTSGGGGGKVDTNEIQLFHPSRLHDGKAGREVDEFPDGNEVTEAEVPESKEGTSLGKERVRATTVESEEMPNSGGAENRRGYKKRGGKKNGKSRFSKAQDEFNRKKKADQMRLETLRRQQEERTKALEKYRQSKAERHHKMSKRTAKGQPLMKFQMEVLLDKIKSQSR
ncbi:uncharacterized protein [Diadema antillarum]|uniref:uncharacterized protein n=1 Tax=Diadema antillarum TaxID=105358 RepID=UPI003A8B66E0